jgi:transposase-like protein
LDHLRQISNDEKKDIVGEYWNRNPDATNRDIAENVECDVHHTTVGNWRNEWDSDKQIAGMYGVTRRWVNEIKRNGDFEEGVQSGSDSDLNTQEEKRVAIWEMVEDNPNESNNYIANQLGVDNETVGTTTKKCEPLFAALENGNAPIKRAIAIIELKSYFGWGNSDVAD